LPGTGVAASHAPAVHTRVSDRAVQTVVASRRVVGVDAGSGVATVLGARVCVVTSRIGVAGAPIQFFVAGESPGAWARQTVAPTAEATVPNSAEEAVIAGCVDLAFHTGVSGFVAELFGTSAAGSDAATLCTMVGCRAEQAVVAEESIGYWDVGAQPIGTRVRGTRIVVVAIGVTHTRRASNLTGFAGVPTRAALNGSTAEFAELAEARRAVAAAADRNRERSSHLSKPNHCDMGSSGLNRTVIVKSRSIGPFRLTFAGGEGTLIRTLKVELKSARRTFADFVEECSDIARLPGVDVDRGTERGVHGHRLADWGRIRPDATRSEKERNSLRRRTAKAIAIRVGGSAAETWDDANRTGGSAGQYAG